MAFDFSLDGLIQAGLDKAKSSLDLGGAPAKQTTMSSTTETPVQPGREPSSTAPASYGAAPSTGGAWYTSTPVLIGAGVAALVLVVVLMRR